MDKLIRRIGEIGIVPVAALENPDDAQRLGQALLEGGLPCVELTYRTPVVPEGIFNLTQAYPEMLIGAGTVLSVAQAEKAVAAGAKFILAPGFDPEIVDWCQAHNVLIMPGVMTPTDVSLAVKKGVRLLKFFPAAAAGGPDALKAISAPFMGVKFVPTGGISADNLGKFLQMPMVQACGGSWLVKKQLIDTGSFSEITRLTREAVAIVHRVRSGNS